MHQQKQGLKLLIYILFLIWFPISISIRSHIANMVRAENEWLEWESKKFDKVSRAFLASVAAAVVAITHKKS
jgi:hypothetical protein